MKKVVLGGFMMVCATLMWLIASINRDLAFFLTCVGVVLFVVGIVFAMVYAFSNDK